MAGSGDGELIRTAGGLQPANKLRAAGLKVYGAYEGTHLCLQADGRPPTPPGVRKWRRDDVPGRRVRHPGYRDDPGADESKVYGKVLDKGPGGTADAIATSKTRMEQYMEDRGAAVYRTTQREKLGKGFHHNQIPSRVRDPSFAFGKPVVKDPDGGKKSLFPEATDDESKRHLYIKSHAAWAPGERRDHGTDFGRANRGKGIDPNAHRFGKLAANPEKNGVGKVLNPDVDPTAVRSRLVPLRVEATRQFQAHKLGKSKHLGLAPYGRAKPEVFGRQGPDLANTVTAGDCIRGNYNHDDQQPDEDIGRATRPGFRNVAKDPRRVFGVPSLRSDVPPRKTNIAEPQNFGQDPGMNDLLNPSAYAGRGVDNKDFVAERDQEDVRSVFEAIGEPLEDEEFQILWARAASHYDLSKDGRVSLEEFRLALNAYRDECEENGRPPAWYVEAQAKLGAGAAAGGAGAAAGAAGAE